MELILERIKMTKTYTLSRLYEKHGPKLFVLDVVEPPVAGMALTRIKALDCGRYKLYVKGDTVHLQLFIVFQAVPRRNRFSIVQLDQTQKLEDIKFAETTRYSNASIFAGKVDKNIMQCDEINYQRFLMRLVIAKQQKEIIYLTIK